MTLQYQELLIEAYSSFNARNIDAVLELMQPDVHWANGWEGGFVEGKEELRNYWTRQWKELDPNVRPISFNKKENGQIEVDVHQVAKDLKGNVLFDGNVIHVYTFENGLIKSMEIEKS